MDIERTPDRQVVTHDEQGRVILVLDIDRDTETGALLGATRTVWTYYDTGEVNVITIRRYDADQQEIVGAGLRIKHYTDGRPPKSTVI